MSIYTRYPRILFVQRKIKYKRRWNLIPLIKFFQVPFSFSRLSYFQRTQFGFWNFLHTCQTQQTYIWEMSNHKKLFISFLIFLWFQKKGKRLRKLKMKCSRMNLNDRRYKPPPRVSKCDSAPIVRPCARRLACESSQSQRCSSSKALRWRFLSN